MKIRFLICFLICSLALVSCNKPNNANSSKPDETIYDTPDISGSNVVYVKTNSGYIPICYLKSSNLMLEEENYYYDLQNIVKNDDTLNKKSYTSFDIYGSNLGKTDYDTLEKDKSDPFSKLFTSANWKLCPSISINDYNSKKHADNSYKQFIFDSFSENFSTLEDVTITQIKHFDLDGDGSNEAVVTAKGKDFTIVALLSQSLGNKILTSAFNDTSFSAETYFIDYNADGKFALFVMSGNSFKKITAYKDCSVTYDYTVYLPLQ